MKILVLLAFAFAAFNTGLIWMVQVVHYPGFLHLNHKGYEEYQNFHMRSISFIVGPSMLLELTASSLLFPYFDQLTHPITYSLSFGMLLLIFANTAFWAAPTHSKMLAGFNNKLINRLIKINWWRTVLWSARALILGYLLYFI
ncbi:MAG: hypothetical protein JXR10_17110 [Cyclobacteriaceae bacterium]